MHSMMESLRSLFGGAAKERSIFKTEREAYDFCRQAYNKSGGVPPELQRAYEFYAKNYNDGCENDRDVFCELSI